MPTADVAAPTNATRTVACDGAHNAQTFLVEDLPDEVAAAEPGQAPPPRPRPAEADRKEDHPYYVAEVARVNAELVRPVLDRGGPPATVQSVGNVKPSVTAPPLALTSSSRI